MNQTARDFLIGLCTIGACIGLAVLLIRFGELNSPNRYELTIPTVQAAGIKHGSNVTLNGVKVGVVVSVEPTDDPRWPVSIVAGIDTARTIPSSAVPYSNSSLLGTGASLLLEVAPGDPALAAELVHRLAPLEAEIDHEWGYDHGSWAVLKKIYPDADVPLIQLSMDIRQPSSWHYEAGKKLAAFRDDGVLVMGSGNIVHNLPEMNWRMRDGSYDWAARFGDYIRESIASDEPEKLVDYESFGRDARLSVPSPDHYWPLLYVMGARAKGEPAHFETPVVEYGSLDMTTVVFGA